MLRPSFAFTEAEVSQHNRQTVVDVSGAGH
jgi:hypothetical protein